MMSMIWHDASVSVWELVAYS